MWWTYAAGSFGERYGPLDKYAAFAALGSGGQLVAVIPGLDLVVVHRGDTDNNRPVGGGRSWSIVARIIAAHTGEAKSRPRLVPVTPIPFASQLPAYVEPAFIELPRQVLEGYYGEYEFAKGSRIRIFEWRGRPFMLLAGEGEGELFAVARDSFTVRAVTGLKVNFVRDAAGGVSAVTVNMANRVIRATKIR
jgi:hypothetical protein